MTHRDVDLDQVHDGLDDVSEHHRRLTTEQLEAATILGWGPTRFTRRQWHAIEDLVTWRHKAEPCGT